MRRIFTTLAAAFALCASVMAADIKRAEPLSWFTGMKTDLQIMFYGDGIGAADVTVKGLNITGVHKAESPNYLFVDVDVPAQTKPGTYTFKFKVGGKTLSYPYKIEERKTGSADRQGFDSSDLIYLIMPDRFANGDPSNDSTDDTAEKVNRENANGRHGGDLKGIIDHLDYIKSLGVTAIWNTPLLLDDEPRGSYHGYACSDYYHIDPRYGTNDLFKTFVDESHKRGMKVVMDIVTNHCGTAHWWMNDLPFSNWINPRGGSRGSMGAYSDPNAATIDQDEFSRIWFSGSMPDMNMENPYLLNYFTQWAVWWIEWSGLDSFRVDTYPYNEKENMAKWCANVINEYPNFSIVGECWLGSPAAVSYWDGNKTNFDGFSSNLTSVMDFPLMSAMVNAFKPAAPAAANAQGNGQRRSGGMNGVYDVVAQDFLYADPRTILLFASNHDTNRIADDFDGDPKRTKLAMTILATMRGIPQIYYGDEILARASKADRPGDGDKRIDFSGGWKGDAVNLFTAEGRSAEQNEVWNHMATLFNWRKTKDVIHNGKTMHFRPVATQPQQQRQGGQGGPQAGQGGQGRPAQAQAAAPQTPPYIYFRYNDNAKVMVAINNSDSEVTVDWSRISQMTQDIKTGTEILTGKKVTVGEKLTIPAMESLVIEF